MIRDEVIRHQLRSGEDSRWRFKPIKFDGDTPVRACINDLADELGALANGGGGAMLCQIADDSTGHGMSREQLIALNRLLGDVCTEIIEPPLRVGIYHRELDGRAFVLAEVPCGETVHERCGNAFIRAGTNKSLLSAAECLRLKQDRAQNQLLRFERQIVAGAGFDTLDERLWDPLLSLSGAAEPRRGLRALRLLELDDSGEDRATVAGILLATPDPQKWFPQATIVATCCCGTDEASGQLETQEIVGPLSRQIADAVKFVVRNMRVSASQNSQKDDLSQYSKSAVFEAVVNAVAHRDYSMFSRKIRLSMFEDRLEIESPGQPPNSMTIDGMEYGQSARNEVIASVLRRISVTDVAGADHREFMMERRGDGVSIIRKETEAATGLPPEYEVVDESSLVVRIPAAKLELLPGRATITAHSEGKPLAGIEVIALFPNKTWVHAVTDESGDAVLELYTTHLPMTIYAAGLGYRAGLKTGWTPNQGRLLLELDPLEFGGTVILAQGIGSIPGLNGQVEPTLDNDDRARLYAHNIAINEGRQQPVSFRLGRPFRLTDSFGAEMSAAVVDIRGRSSLVEFQPFEP